MIDRFKRLRLRTKLTLAIVFFFFGPSMFSIIYSLYFLGFSNTVVETLIVITFFALIIAVLVAYWISTYFTAPLIPLQEAVQKLSEGDLAYRVRISSKDEIAQISSSFNDMADSIHKLVNELREDTEELTVLYHAGASLTKSLRPSELYPLIADVVQHSLNPDLTLFTVFDTDTFKYRQKGFAVLGDTQIKEVIGMLNNLVKMERKPVLLIDSSALPSLPKYGSVIITPLTITDRIVGAIAAFSANQNFFSEKHLRFLETFSNQVSVALHRANLYGELEEMAVRDDLTGLYNFRYLHSQLDKELLAAKERNEKLSLIILDLDYFKEINDTYGHLAGDDVLRQIADVLVTTVRTVDIVARYGGEEFVTILPNADQHAALVVARRLRKAVVSKSFNLANGVKSEPGLITVSLGIATFPESGQKKEELIRAADVALYSAKKSGRNAVGTVA